MTGTDISGDTALLATSPSTHRQRHAARAALLVSVAAFLLAAPFARTQLPRIDAFVPIYQSAMVVCDLITAAILFGQAHLLRSRGLLALAVGYVFTAMMAGLHMASFPGLFAPGGLFGSGPQTTAWLYMCWHAGFPLCVLAYVRLQRPGEAAPLRRPGLAVAGAVAAALGVALALFAAATAGHAVLPPIMVGNRYAPAMVAVVSGVWLLSGTALVMLTRRRTPSSLDLWLTVVMWAWVFDIALSAVLNAGRFDLGFYAGRMYGLLAAGFVLIVLLLEHGALHVKLLSAHRDQREKAEKMCSLSKEVESTNEKLRDSNEQLRKSSQMKSEFLASMSHELRTPLNSVIGFSELLADGLAGPLGIKQHTMVSHVHEAGKHLLSLVNDLLDLSKIEAGRFELDLGAIDLRNALADSAAINGERARAKQIDLRFELRELPDTLLADERRVKQILYNLVGNAIKFTPNAGRVTVKASRVDAPRARAGLPGAGPGVRTTLPDVEASGFVELSVFDSGIGIEPSDLGKLFQSYGQVLNTKTRGLEGTGLGLAMVRQLAELHGGAVAATSEAGRGSCFTVWLPWREEPVPPTLEAAPARPPHPLCALVVEDDEAAATLLRRQLEAEGFRVRVVTSAEAALELAHDFRPDLITLDILLPGIDGWTLLSKMKELPNWEGVPVVVVSVAADQGHGVSLGASLVLQKPVSREALAKGLARIGLLPETERISVLVVDNDPVAVEMIASQLRNQGCIVLRALDGHEGIELARRFRPKLIALDLEMVDMSGFDVVESLKESPDTAHIPIFIVTAQSPSETERARLSSRIHDIVDKTDFTPGRFMAEVRRALSIKDLEAPLVGARASRQPSTAPP